MRNPIPLAALAALTALALAACKPAETTTTPTPPVAAPSAWPSAKDAYEGAGGDDTCLTASSLPVGGRQLRSLFPDGDVDWVKIDVLAGHSYELSAYDLSTRTDTFLTMFADDCVTELALGGALDDYIGTDSRKQFDPDLDATFYVKVTSFAARAGATGSAMGSYTLKLAEFEDADGDGYSPTYDCDDADSTVHPFAVDVPGNGQDENCNGIDDLDPALADAAEPDNGPATAKYMTVAAGSELEVIRRSETFRYNARTLTPGDQDWFRVTVPAKTKVHVSAYKGAANGATMTIYASDAVTVPGVPEVTKAGFDADLANTTATAKQYYAKYAFGTAPLFYVPYQYSVGQDLDGDGYYTHDYDGARDCDDANAAVHPGATEVPGDLVDSNCNGDDDL